MSYFNRTEIVDSTGNGVEVGLFGGLKTSQSNTQISLTFEKPLNTERVVKLTGTPTAQYNRSLLRVQSGEAIETIDVLRYKTAQTIETYFTANFVGTFGAGTDESYIGLYDVEDGVFLGYYGSDFVVGYRNINKNGVGTEPDVRQVVDMSAYDVTKIHRFRIRFGYLGVGNIVFEVFDGTSWDILHLFETDAFFTDRTHVGTAILPMRCQVNHTDCEMRSGSWNAQTYGVDTGKQEEPFFTSGQRTVAGNVVAQPLVAFRNKATYGGYTNKIKSQLLYSEFGTGSEGLYEIEIYAFPAGTLASGTWNDVDTFSVLETNETFTEGITGGKLVYGTQIAVQSSGTGVASRTLDFTRLGIKANPSQEFGVYKRQIIGGGGDDVTTWNIAYADLF